MAHYRRGYGAAWEEEWGVGEAIPPIRQLFVDLGRVEVIAEVRLNGKDLGVLWEPPLRVEVTRALKPGENTLEVKVVNLWAKRQIGDEQLPEDGKRSSRGRDGCRPANRARRSAKRLRAGDCGRRTTRCWNPACSCR